MSGTAAGTRASGAVAAMLVLFGLVAGIFFYNAQAVGQQREASLVSNVAGRLRADVERYVNDVVLMSEGEQADPAGTLAEIRATAQALAQGGKVPALQGGGELVLPRPPGSSFLKAKLDQQQRLIAALAERGRAVLAGPASGRAHEAALLHLRVVGAQLSSVTGDVVGQITKDDRSALARFNRIQLFLGVVSAIAALAVGIVSMRAGRSREAARYRALANHSTDLVTVTGADGTVRYVSPSVRSILGLAPDALLGTAFIDLVHPEDRELVGAALGDLAAHPETPVRLEYRVADSEGRWRMIESGWTNLVGDAAVGGLVANSRDVSDRHSLEEELRRKAFLDDLTSLPNRALFGDRVEQAVQRARRSGGRVTVLFVDLDDFKTVNDSMGHTTGDHLLVAVAARLHACVRPSDTAARLGGDEFGILLEDGSTVDTAESIAERLINALRDPFVIDGHSLVVSASVGIACQGAADISAEEILRDADVAMYVAKTRGKARAEVFAERMHRAVVERQKLGADLQQALRRGELEVFYQPLVDLRSGRVVGVEALLRWHHPTRGAVPPVVFIPIAEEIGAIIDIGRWVLEQACSQIREWTSRHPAVAGLAVTVNISPFQLASAGLHGDVRDALSRTGIRPDQLVLEITEGALIGDDASVIDGLLHLRTLGVRLAIDDFGTGYSSLSQLRQLPVDMLKIDKSFIDNAVDGGKGTALLHSIIELGRVLDLEVVAEGIEDGDQAEELRQSGSQLGQGFFYAMPASAPDLEALMARGSVEVATDEAVTAP